MEMGQGGLHGLEVAESRAQLPSAKAGFGDGLPIALACNLGPADHRAQLGQEHGV